MSPPYTASLSPAVIAADHLHLRLFKIDLLPIDTRWNTPDVQSTFWRFYLNDGDGAALELADGVYPLRANRLYFVPAGVRFTCRCALPVRHFYAHFDVIGLPDVVTRSLFAAPLCLPPNPRMEQAAQGIMEALRGPDVKQDSAMNGSNPLRGTPPDLILQCQVKALLYEGLALHLASLSPAQRERGEELRRILQPLLPAIERIEQSLAAPLSTPLLAQCCCLSPNHFIRRFRACTGQTPGQYVQERRIKAAAQRLLFTDETLDHIAEATGFGNRYYLSRVFARHTGLSPAAYRRSSRP